MNLTKINYCGVLSFWWYEKPMRPLKLDKTQVYTRYDSKFKQVYCRHSGPGAAFRQPGANSMYNMVPQHWNIPAEPAEPTELLNSLIVPERLTNIESMCRPAARRTSGFYRIHTCIHLGSIHTCDLLWVNYCVNLSLKNKLYCTAVDVGIHTF